MNKIFFLLLLISFAVMAGDKCPDVVCPDEVPPAKSVPKATPSPKAKTAATNIPDMDAYQWLEEYIEAGIAEKMEVTVKEKPFCGEVDPYFLGDSCVVVAESSVSRKLGRDLWMYFEDDGISDPPAFRVGDKLSLWGILLDDGITFGLDENYIEYAVRER